jgi:hypothetical protein
MTISLGSSIHFLYMENFMHKIYINIYLFLWMLCIWHLLFSSPDPKGHVSYCRHWASVVCRPSSVRPSVRPSVNFPHFNQLLWSKKALDLRINKPNLHHKKALGLNINKPNLHYKNALGLNINKPNLHYKKAVGQLGLLTLRPTAFL